MAESGAPFVSVVVVAYQSEKDLNSCLGSLISENVDEIFVLENGSPEISRKETARICADHDRVHFKQSHQNLGFGGGVNLALSLIGQPERTDHFVWVLNPDTKVSSGCVTKLVESLRGEHYDMVSPRIATGPEQSPVLWFGGGEIDRSRVLSRHLDFGMPFTDRQENIESTFLSGAAIMARREVWQALGGFDEDFFLYWEDADLSVRAKDLGLRMGVIGAAELWHEVGGSAEGSGKSIAYHYYMQRNRMRIGSRWHTPISMLMGRPGVETWKQLARAGFEKDGKFRKLTASMKGIMDGSRGA